MIAGEGSNLPVVKPALEQRQGVQSDPVEPLLRLEAFVVPKYAPRGAAEFPWNEPGQNVYLRTDFLPHGLAEDKGASPSFPIDVGVLEHASPVIEHELSCEWVMPFNECVNIKCMEMES
jgi:hypothetical protein